jgi:formate hydrogenlyase subunit 6/NADH:ubiquinone oxidoreductase subunit I
VKKIPVLYNRKENCCGCTACYSICPVHAISMELDEEGFLYPTVDKAICTCCYKCLEVCAFKVYQNDKGYIVP